MMIRVPTKPTATADQRRGPTFSPRTSGDRAVTTRGWTKKIARASAMGRNFSDQKKKNVGRDQEAGAQAVQERAVWAAGP